MESNQFKSRFDLEILEARVLLSTALVPPAPNPQANGEIHSETVGVLSSPTSANDSVTAGRDVFGGLRDRAADIVTGHTSRVTEGMGELASPASKPNVGLQSLVGLHSDWTGN